MERRGRGTGPAGRFGGGRHGGGVRGRRPRAGAGLPRAALPVPLRGRPGRECGRPSTALGLPVTAHPLGGCPIGADPATSVADLCHRVHGYPTLHIADASAVPGNLGVDPALTMTALAERACAAWPAAGHPDRRPAQSEPYRRVPLPKTEDPLCPTLCSSASPPAVPSSVTPLMCCRAATCSSTA
ncbi:GMC oxidoreductase [Streptomyces paradoxus]|uniref:GMC oxidoreductase n=1 Tax=Streptomyces paradoxus TaxID=66375 RepID=UPI003701D667